MELVVTMIEYHPSPLVVWRGGGGGGGDGMSLPNPCLCCVYNTTGM